MNNQLTRRSFIQGLGATTASVAISSCGINSNRNPTKLTEAALSVQPIIDPKTLEKPNLT